jgi:hypothetical protein
LYRTGPALAAIVTVLALASCGGGSSGGTTSGGQTGQTKVTASQARTGKCVRSSPHIARQSANSCGDGGGSPSHAASAGTGGCASRLGEFVGRMDDLRQSLLAGLSYSEYVVRVRAIRDAYEAIPVDRLGAGCLAGAASDAEDAFNQYLRAANVWGECAGTAGCAASEIEGRLQRRWRIASKSLAAAENG